jgi:hypothetical protein
MKGEGEVMMRARGAYSGGLPLFTIPVGTGGPVGPNWALHDGHLSGKKSGVFRVFGL